MNEVQGQFIPQIFDVNAIENSVGEDRKKNINLFGDTAREDHFVALQVQGYDELIDRILNILQDYMEVQLFERIMFDNHSAYSFTRLTWYPPMDESKGQFIKFGVEVIMMSALSPLSLKRATDSK